MRRLVCLGVMVSTGLMAACSSDSLPTTGSGGTGGAGGASAAAGTTGHAGAGGAAGQAAAGAGGSAAGTGGSAAGTGGSAAGTGGNASACLDPSMFSTSFTIADSAFCAVALHTAPESLSFQSPTWGSHGGPLVVQQAAIATGVTLERWTAPTGNSGAMTVQTTPVAAALPATTFLGGQAVDLPFFGWTAISWTNPFPASTGVFEMIASGAIPTSYALNGPYSAAAVSATSTSGRLFFSALSPIGLATTATAGLYEADSCSLPGQALGTGTDCSASAVVAAWGDNDGPVAADSNGDVFAVMTSFTAGTQEARGFLASSVARGAAATTGVTLFTIAGYSGSLAALSPSGANPGLVVFQPIDSTSNDALDVLEQKFTTGTALAVVGTQSPFLTVPSGSSGLSLLVDGAQRLWVATSGTSSTTYVVLARRS